MTNEERIWMGRAFHRALLSRDWPQIRSLLTEDATWTLPGDNLISGQAIGADDVTARARRIASFGVSFTLKHILTSRDNLALSIRNTASRADRTLDEHLAAVCQIQDGKISKIETFLSDVEGMNAFFSRE